MDIPKIDTELVEYLEKLYPDRAPSLTTPEREVWFQSGQADLVRLLRAILDEQNQTVLAGETNVLGT